MIKAEQMARAIAKIMGLWVAACRPEEEPRWGVVVINDDDESKPVLFDLIKTWGGDVITLLLAGLILLITPLLQKYNSSTLDCFSAAYWNLKNLQFRFSHSRN